MTDTCMEAETDSFHDVRLKLAGQPERTYDLDMTKTVLEEIQRIMGDFGLPGQAEDKNMVLRSSGVDPTQIVLAHDCILSDHREDFCKFDVVEIN